MTVRFSGDDDEVTFLLASREESGAPIDVYSPRSPLGAAIMGKKVGETRPAACQRPRPHGGDPGGVPYGGI